MKSFYFSFLLLLLVIVLSSCSDKQVNDRSSSLDISVDEVGQYHNVALDYALEAIDGSPLMNSFTRGSVSINDYAQCLAQAQSAILKNSQDFHKLSVSQVPSYVHDALNVTLSERSITSIRLLLTDPSYSLTQDLKQEFPNEVSSVVEAYLNEMIDLFKTSNDYTYIENYIDRIHLKWYREANQDDREIISSTTNVAISSLDYWRNHASQWDATLKGNALRGFIIGVTVADFSCITRIVLIGRQYSVIFWKEIAAAAAAYSAGSAIEGLVGSLVDWVLGNHGYQFVYGTERMDFKDFSNLVEQYCIQELTNSIK